MLLPRVAFSFLLLYGRAKHIHLRQHRRHLPQSVTQRRIPLHDVVILHHLPDNLFPADQHHQLSRAGQRRVEQIPCQQHHRAVYHRQNHHRELAALTFVHRQAVR